MTKRRIFFYPFYFFFNQNNYFPLNTFIVGFDSLFEIVGAIFVNALCDDGNGLIRLHFGRNLGNIHHNLSVENLLVDTFIKVVGEGSDKHTLCEVGDFESRDKTIELRGDGSRFVIELDSDEPTMAFLKQTLIKRRNKQNPSDL